MMLTIHKAHLLAQLAKWRLTWSHYDPDHLPQDAGPKFVSARQAAELFPDDATVLSCGMAGHHRPSALFWALRDRFREQAHPRGLTWCCVSAIGGRGMVPGTIEELAEPGLLKTWITGHHETAKALLALAESGQLELHTMSQGQFSLLIEAQAAGELSRVTDVGVGTFSDPRVGRGSPVTEQARLQLIEAVDGDLLRYSLPRLQFAVFALPYADREGNLYATDAACLTEVVNAAAAVHRNDGTVIVTVAGMTDPAPEKILIPSSHVDAIVVNPLQEQVGSVRQLKSWPMFTEGARVDRGEALDDIRFVNETLRITPRRSEVDRALARLTAATMAAELFDEAVINIGVGLPEEAAGLLYEAGLADRLHQSTETGVRGGIPARGVFFGAAVNPEQVGDSASLFHDYEKRLDLACLGLLEVDSLGNVNVSRRGPKVTDYVGPGGFTDIAHHAKVIVYAGSFAAHARMHQVGARIVVDDPGTPKFVQQVQEVTFNAARALQRGQRIWYVTHLGVFRLTGEGVQLVWVMPGIDVQRDILDHSDARILLPDSGLDAVRTVDPGIVTGEGFSLTLGPRK